VADVNRDGFDDLFVSEMRSRSRLRRQVQHSLLEVDPLPAWGWGWNPGVPDTRVQVMRNTLAMNRGDGTFTEAAFMYGVDSTDWTWSCLFLDVDLDGYEDLLIANGHSRDLANSDSLAALDRLPPARDAKDRLKSDVTFLVRKKATLATLEKTLTHRERAKDILEKQLDELNRQKLTLKTEIESIEVEYKALALQQIENKYQKDDSRLSGIKQTLEKLRKDLEVKQERIKLDPVGVEAAKPASKESVDDILAPLTGGKKTIDE
jgi:hypothetical protein